MKKCLFIPFLFVHLVIMGQNNDEPVDTTVINSWQFEDNYFFIDPSPVDTSLDDFQVINPFFKRSFSNTFLGNIGLAGQSNIFYDRLNHDVFWLENYLVYMHTPCNILFYNTRKPYTNIFYSNGGSQRDSEQTLSVLHTQNVTRNFNIGLKFDLYSSEGQYAFQKTRNNGFSIFSSLVKNKYSLFGNASINKLQFEENGGIIFDTALIELGDNPAAIGVRLMSGGVGGDNSIASSTIGTKSIFLKHGWTFGKNAIKKFPGDLQENFTVDSLIIDDLNNERSDTLGYNGIDTLGIDSIPYPGNKDSLQQDEFFLDTIDSKNIDTIVSKSVPVEQDPIGKNDTLSMGNGTFYSINHVLKFQNASYNYNDVSPANGFYEFVIDSTLTNDSSYYRTLYNSLRFEIHEPTKGSMPGMIFSLDHEWNRYAHKIYLHRPLDDTIFQLSTPFENNISNYQADTTEQGIVYENMITNNITNFGLSAAIYKNNGQNIRWKIFGQYFLLGYKKGNYHFGSDLKTLFSDESFLKLVLKARNEQPGFFYENFSSNHFIWKNNFSNEKYYTVALNYFNERWSFNTGISFSLINDKVYFNTSAVPAQYKNPITLYVLDVKKDFVLWKFHLDNKVAFQYIDETHEQILSLPKLALHNSTYFEQEVNFWTGGKLRFQIGFDLYYHTSFFVHAYMPVTNSFYLQKEKEIGNYPFVDAFANVAIKRFRIFAKFAHANAGFTGYDYFTALHYPAGWRMFKLGLSWRFYD